MTEKTEIEIKAGWIEHGQLSAGDRAIMQMVVDYTPKTDSIGTFELKQWRVAHELMAELFLRGISKKQYMRRMKVSDRWIRSGEMNGTEEGIMKTLFEMIPSTASMDRAQTLTWIRAEQYMAELWLRGVTKAQFKRKMKLRSRKTA
jgi:hypothetical protein